jgi:monofunctional glycosyltransferase
VRPGGLQAGRIEGAGRDAERMDIESPAARHVRRGIADQDDLAPVEITTRVDSRSLHRDGGQILTALAVGAVCAESEPSMQSGRLELECGASLDVAREQTEEDIGSLLECGNELANPGQNDCLACILLQFHFQPVHIDFPETDKAFVNRGIDETLEPQQFPRDLRIRLAAERVCGDRPGRPVDFDHRAQERAFRRASRPQQGSIDIEQDELPHRTTDAVSMFRRLLIAVALALTGALLFWWLSLPWPLALRWHEPSRSALMKMRIHEARVADQTLEIRHEYVPLENLSRNLQRAIILAEDGRFEEHDGIDWSALAEEFHYHGDKDFSFLDPGDLAALFGALRYYIANREEVRGRSTITQQLAKNLYFSTNRSVARKIEELIVARRLERFLSKDRILELYLNFAEFGPGVFGAESAARLYYGKSAKSLTVEQAITLAATLPQPLTANPKKRPGRLEWRKDLIRQRMRGS